MKTSPAGLDALAKREGYRLKAYKDSRGIWSIGIGHTGAAGPPQPEAGMTLTYQSMLSLFAVDIVQYEDAVNESIKVPMTQNEFDACVSLCFNIGVNGFKGSSVVHFMNVGNKAAAGNAFLMWERPPELRGRRVAELKQFESA